MKTSDILVLQIWTQMLRSQIQRESEHSVLCRLRQAVQAKQARFVEDAEVIPVVWEEEEEEEEEKEDE